MDSNDHSGASAQSTSRSATRSKTVRRVLPELEDKLQLENLKFKVLLSNQNPRYILAASESASAAKDRLNQLGSNPWKINSEVMALFIRAASPCWTFLALPPRSELTGYDWFILVRKKMSHWRKAHLIPPHLNHSAITYPTASLVRYDFVHIIE
ncbi:uncharacterized protein LOC119765601 [Culex quinquefasciatus]|uniref:uncharacterized protein LOC119765601 n=1 Tax=Culex quinquefasciatus TaxID=7176 RepID=UPI0018E341C7|nr:uncharacterized protein LOC119765601 [Culex quinquefasciatus]